MKPFDFFGFTSGQDIKRGDLLISQPFMKDLNFGRAVVFICEHTDEGSFGFVLNKISPLKFDEVMEIEKPYDKELFIGGPVEQNTLHFLHRIPDKIAGQEVKNGIYWSGDYEALLTLIDEESLDKEDIMFFLGYSGWSVGQLEKELETGSWMIYKGTSLQDIFNNDKNDFWAQLLKKMGGKYGVFANYPEDPSLN